MRVLSQMAESLRIQLPRAATPILHMRWCVSRGHGAYVHTPVWFKTTKRPLQNVKKHSSKGSDGQGERFQVHLRSNQIHRFGLWTRRHKLPRPPDTVLLKVTTDGKWLPTTSGKTSCQPTACLKPQLSSNSQAIKRQQIAQMVRIVLLHCIYVLVGFYHIKPAADEIATGQTKSAGKTSPADA